ncbi:MAG TPA: hypothetical protein VFF29_06115 [Bacteroidota bacterium]|nr:hypothetical protein [Bacteroidota bacterium]
MKQHSESTQSKDGNQLKPTYEEYASFIQRLREEGNDLKDCFTKFTFQAVLFTAAALGLIGTLGLIGNTEQDSYSAVYKSLNVTLATVLICVPVTQILQTVVRIGLYKYGSSNRHFGYQLYLENKGMFNITWDDLNWEIKMIAWRIIQPTIFNLAYKVSSDLKIRNAVKSVFPFVESQCTDIPAQVQYWWKINYQINGHSAYHAGSYLRRMSMVLNMLTYFTLSVMVLSVVIAWGLGLSPITIGMTIFVSIWIFYVFQNIIANGRRRVIVESEMLSIYCCSEVWNIIDNVLGSFVKQNDDLLKYICSLASRLKVDILTDWPKHLDSLATKRKTDDTSIP